MKQQFIISISKYNVMISFITWDLQVYHYLLNLNLVSEQSCSNLQVLYYLIRLSKFSKGTHFVYKDPRAIKLLHHFVTIVVLIDIIEFPWKLRNWLNRWILFDGVSWTNLFMTWLQVFPGAWTAILISLDNVGIWNLRSQNLDTWYLGQEVYVNVVNPEITDKTELPLPDNAIYCGVLSSLQK